MVLFCPHSPRFSSIHLQLCRHMLFHVFMRTNDPNTPPIPHPLIHMLTTIHTLTRSSVFDDMSSCTSFIARYKPQAPVNHITFEAAQTAFAGVHTVVYVSPPCMPLLAHLHCSVRFLGLYAPSCLLTCTTPRNPLRGMYFIWLSWAMGNPSTVKY